ncbi:GntR family transcriptional regulator [Streptomyces sp. NBRC 109706]|uniref:phosphatase domain-containing protein n=1 Tax=Streptomyces sp. NBRC 109706 TaxID=1550035 RepID=UPI000784020A|nr:GntR family transcriptional regulator [Streptomyces sp. NBRC 109706]
MLEPPPERRQPHYQRIAADVREQIMGGSLAHGQILPSEARLASHYGVSVPTLRQALAVLVTQGLVDKQHGRGNFIHFPTRSYTPDPSLPPVVLCDIDGTLALHHDRAPFEFARCDTDRLNHPVRDTLVAWRHTYGAGIVLLSGRPDTWRTETEAWLYSNGVPHDELWMRPADDYRRDDILKAELFDAQVRGRYNVRLVLDDRDRVVALWRRLGLPTWQVNYGTF